MTDHNSNGTSNEPTLNITADMLFGGENKKEENNKSSKITDVNGLLVSNSTDLDLDLVEEELDAENIKSIASSKKQTSDEKNVKDARKTPDKRILGRIWQLTKTEKWNLIWGTVALFLGRVVLVVVPFIVGYVIDITLSADPEAQSKLIEYVLILNGVIILSSLLSAANTFMYNLAGERIVVRLRQQLFKSIMTQEIAFFDENKTGELVNRLSSDCTVIQDTATVNISFALRSLSTMIASVFMIFYISWALTLLILVFVPLLGVMVVIYGRFIKKLSKAFQDALANATDVASEALGNVRTVRSFGKEEFESRRYTDKIQVAFGLARKRAVAFAIVGGVTVFLGNIGIGLVLYVGGKQIMDGTLSAGDLTSFVIYALQTAIAIATLSGLYTEVMKAIGASERVFQLVDRVPVVNWKGGVVPDYCDGHLKMSDVYFAYPSRPDVSVLQGVNLDLKPGTVVALVGMSGGGKSTVVAMLELFYYPNKGKITLDGIDLTTIDPYFLRKNVGLVSQEPALFGTTIAENIAYGLDGISRSKIEEVAKMANAHQFISAFPDGYDTLVGERGIRLSGGQKQRVAIARAFLTDPKILLLDEATSALDAESEYLVKQALQKLMNGRTVLVIAHRLSTVKNATEVCVVHKGKIVERGKHQELLNQKGIYERLVRRQLQSD